MERRRRKRLNVKSTTAVRPNVIEKSVSVFSPRGTGIATVVGLIVVLVAGWILSSIITSTSETLEQESPFFEVVDLPGRGKGAVAIQDIPQGQLVIREEPLFLVQSTTTGSPERLILDHVSHLGPEERTAFFALSHIHLEGTLPTHEHAARLHLAIFQTNAVAAGQNAIGLFPKMARINHGCSRAFNVVYTWRERERALVVHALRPIKAGEELLTTYTDTKRPRDQRRDFLLRHYDFNCSCAVCSLSPPLSRASDERLGAMAELYSRFSTWGLGAIDGKEATEIAIRIWAIGEEEGYWSERGRLAADAAWASAAHSDETAAQGWAQLAIKWYGYEVGADSEQVDEMQSIVLRPESHPSWRTRTDMKVHGPPIGWNS